MKTVTATNNYLTKLDQGGSKMFQIFTLPTEKNILLKMSQKKTGRENS